MPEITPETIWARVSKVKVTYGASDKAWQVHTRKYGSLRPGSHSYWGGDFDTKEEATAFALEKGYVVISAWTEAEAQAAPLTKSLRERRAYVEHKREGLTLIKVGDARRWVTPVDAGRVLALLGEPDEFIRAGEAKDL